jgi:hypothetical protein
VSTISAQLAWAEGRRVLRNPAVWLSLIPTALWFRTVVSTDDGEDGLFLLVGYSLVLPGFVMVIGTVFAVLRSRLERTEPLLVTLAVGQDRRSIGHAWSALAGGAIGLGVIAVIAVALPARDSLGVWDNGGQRLVVPRPNVAQLLQGPMTIVVVLIFIVALVRWVPTWLVLVPLAFLLMVQGLFLGVYHGVPTDGARWLFPLSTGVVHGEWIGDCETTGCDLIVSGFDRVTPWWHLVYLAALALWLTSVAVLRHRRDRTTWTWFGGSLAAVIILAAVQITTAEVYTG